MVNFVTCILQLKHKNNGIYADTDHHRDNPGNTICRRAVRRKIPQCDPTHMKRSKTVVKGSVSVNILKTTEIHTLTGWTVWYRNCISTKLLKALISVKSRITFIRTYEDLKWYPVNSGTRFWGQAGKVKHREQTEI